MIYWRACGVYHDRDVNAAVMFIVGFKEGKVCEERQLSNDEEPL